MLVGVGRSSWAPRHQRSMISPPTLSSSSSLASPSWAASFFGATVR